MEAKKMRPESWGSLVVLGALLATPFGSADVPTAAVMVDTFDVDTVGLGVYDVIEGPGTTYAIEGGVMKVDAPVVFRLDRSVLGDRTGVVFEMDITFDGGPDPHAWLQLRDGTDARNILAKVGAMASRDFINVGGRVSDRVHVPIHEGVPYTMRLTVDTSAEAYTGQLLDADGNVLAEGTDPLPAAATPDAVAEGRINPSFRSGQMTVDTLTALPFVPNLGGPR